MTATIGLVARSEAKRFENAVIALTVVPLARCPTSVMVALVMCATSPPVLPHKFGAPWLASRPAKRDVATRLSALTAPRYHPPGSPN